MVVRYILCEDRDCIGLYPLNMLRHTASIKCGFFFVREKWEFYLESPVYLDDSTRNVLPEEMIPSTPSDFPDDAIYVFLNSRVLPDETLPSKIKKLAKEKRRGIYKDKNGEWIFTISDKFLEMPFDTHKCNLEVVRLDDSVHILKHPWDIINFLSRLIEMDIKILIEERLHRHIPEFNQEFTLIGDALFCFGDVKVEHAVINTRTGPVVIMDGAEVMEGAMVRGPAIIGKSSVIKMGAKIYGPFCCGSTVKVGGEINHSVFFNYSNKAHDGFLGHSIIGSWCNIGADTTVSNLKNTYGNIKAYSRRYDKLVDTGMQFLGVIMGDCTRTGINTTINSGTIIGCGCCLWGSGFMPKHIPPLQWGTPQKLENYEFPNFYEHLLRMMGRRDIKPYPEMKNKLEESITNYEKFFQ